MNQEFQNKNDYSISAFSPGGFLCKYQYVGNVFKFVNFLNGHQTFNQWDKINVYARRTGRFIGQFRKGQFIPPFPK